MSIFDTDKTIHIAGVLRCAKNKYNKAFLEKGAIKFGLPQSWVNIGKQYGEGRGDVAEGMFATFNNMDLERVVEFGRKYNIPNDEVVVDRVGSRIFYRYRETINLPTFCLYGIKFDLFDVEPRVGEQRIHGVIPGKYFTAFSDNIDGSDETVSDDEKPSAIFITDYDLLKERIVSKLKEIGVSEEEIIAEPIQYYDTKKYGENYYYEVTSERPKELLWKREEFKEQSEIRIIVNSKNESAMSILRSEVIEIGELTDIAQLANANFDNGLHVAMTIKICEME